ncbi:patatin-like phospholipase family protein [Fulvivirgaceae bacterium BMA12]|uniref:Patatin-like phospholipase family protein n=1 Tax=Agaribacillus aureus TaxID=3051825 RepID=A0ABT8L962_9BACT|nr:patatin-like phospholipase family protein [Fulvivirgaceae bacterium BMA12]
MKIGLALSGGGARGIAHIGIIKALEEHGIRPSAISGTSAGAVVGAMYSYGYTPDEILQIILKTSFIKRMRPALAKTGLLKIENLRDTFLKYLPENNFSALKIPLSVAATELKRGKTTFFSEGELITPVLASCCVPVLFNPVKFGDGLYVDGGILDNLPVEPIMDKTDFIIGSHTNPIDDDFDVKNVKVLIERSLLMAINGNTQKRKEMCNLLIEPPGLKKYAGSELNKARELFDIGYQFTKENFDRFSIPK